MNALFLFEALVCSFLQSFLVHFFLLSEIELHLYRLIVADSSNNEMQWMGTSKYILSFNVNEQLIMVIQNSCEVNREPPICSGILWTWLDQTEWSHNILIVCTAFKFPKCRVSRYVVLLSILAVKVVTKFSYPHFRSPFGYQTKSWVTE